MSELLLGVHSVTKRFGSFVALSDISLEIGAGERIGIIGPNGSGKTTLINCVSGRLRPESGRVMFGGEDVTRMQPHRRAQRGLARTFQIPQPFHGMTLVENLYVPLEYGAGGTERPNRAALRESALRILDSLGLGGKADEGCGALSQIELRKLELARALAVNPRLLVSDEAMAGLSVSEVDEVLDILFALADRGITVIMIEHIMHAIMRFSEPVLCIVSGKLIVAGPPDEIVRHPEVQRAYIGD
ncbi:ABC transporter ATP-binding protein [Paraburkholderia domus]|uniref:ABC transporter ATP-binding protein n=1 Tax=Paraburkholderia domus TaxID=2793075 RepID=UPI001B23BD22|nr:ABC transporter ATP-binding protein [Paraburkholderia domus]CAE6825884.1 Lipopolysaccharide export system ATP-binding protein LptB [Paraburkholderia domus]